MVLRIAALDSSLIPVAAAFRTPGDKAGDQSQTDEGGNIGRSIVSRAFGVVLLVLGVGCEGLEFQSHPSVDGGAGGGAQGRGGGSSGGGNTGGGTGGGNTGGGNGGGSANCSGASVPTDPKTYSWGHDVIMANAPTGTQFNVPLSYDTSHCTPMNLLVWFHGYGGSASADIDVVAPDSLDQFDKAWGDAWTKISKGRPRTWIALAMGGEDGGGWNWNSPTSKDMTALLNTVAELRKHLNINPTGIYLGGYSNGGNFTYYAGFRHADMFAGFLTVNSDPYNDSDGRAFQGQADAAAAQPKLPLIHLAHSSDTTYPLNKVQANFASMKSAGFTKHQAHHGPGRPHGRPRRPVSRDHRESPRPALGRLATLR